MKARALTMAAKSKDAHLYGVPRAKKQASNSATIASASNLAFSSALSSLIQSSSSTTSSRANNVASESNSRTVPGRQRASRTKDDIFKTQNRNIKKRAAADMLAHEAESSRRRTGDEGAPMDDTAWKRTKRKMEEKARLYAALKRGDVEDADERHMVDFDRKWAEQEAKREGERTSSDDDGTEDSEGEELVEYTDEFGRSRRGTRAQVAREERRRKAQAADEPDRFTARPSAPSNIIYGDTIQAEAFNPDQATAVQMEELAAKRDRELTPPEALHYDATAEIRNKGTGFFQFSKDEEERQEQMRNLEKERLATERAREQRNAKVEQRKKDIEERRRLIREKRGKMQADKFLDRLSSEFAQQQQQRQSYDDTHDHDHVDDSVPGKDGNEKN